MPLTAVDIVSDYPITQRVPATILASLINISPRVAGTQSLRDDIEAVTGSRASEASVHAAIKRARKAVKGIATIECLNGIGYRIKFPQSRAEVLAMSSRPV